MGPSTDIHTLKQNLQAIDRSIQIVQQATERERSSLHYDRFGRRASEMPHHLRGLYEAGAWRNKPVYIWPQVLSVSQDGHARASLAEKSLRHLHYRPSVPLPPHPALAEAAVRDARDVVDRVSERVRAVVKDRNEARESRKRALARSYVTRRKAWMNALRQERSSRSQAERAAHVRDDRALLVATRAPSGMGSGMSEREIDLIFSEIEAAGGTAGGLERWGRSITGIPDQNPHYLPPASDGGVLIENPLAYHYAARNINPWTRAEKLLFLEKFLVHGKNFRKVSTFFEHKSNDDVVRFYFDNKKQLKLKELAKENNVRKRSTKRAALVELSKMPHESRSIKDNFLFQEDVLSESETEAEKESLKAEKLSQGTLGKGWSSADRQALIFALCRFDVTKDDESKPVPTLWTNIASVVGNKTPRQCRQFYFEYKTILGLDGYSPPKPMKRAASSPAVGDSQNGPRKQARHRFTVNEEMGRGEVPSRTEIIVNGES